MSRLQRGITGLSSVSRHGSQASSMASSTDKTSNKSFEELKRLIQKSTGRRPLIMPVILEI